METRWYFVLGDIAANILVATVAFALSSWLIGGALGMFPSMLIGMVLGMAITLPLSLGMLSTLLGVMEVMCPCMLSGMFGGMFGAMRPLDGAEILPWGAATGIAVVVVIYLANALLSGPQKLKS